MSNKETLVSHSISIANSLSLELLQELYELMDLVLDPDSNEGCQTPRRIKKSNKKTGGYKQITIPGTQNKALCHQVAWRLKNGGLEIGVGMVVSHICGRSTCCNADHLEVCTKDWNESRKYCHNGTFTICPHAMQQNGAKACIVSKME